MTPRLLNCILVIGLIAGLTSTSLSAERGDQSKLIPASFDGDGGTSGKYTKKVKRSAFHRMLSAAKTPRLLPKKQGPSFFEKVGNSTKRMAKKTRASVSNPLKIFKGPSKSKYTSSRGSKKSVKTSWIGKIFASRESNGPPSTVTGFLGQDRP